MDKYEDDLRQALDDKDFDRLANLFMAAWAISPDSRGTFMENVYLRGYNDAKKHTLELWKETEKSE